MPTLPRPWNPVEVRRTVPASPAETFAVIADPETYPRWLVGTKRMRHVDPDFPRPGAELHHTVGAGPVSIDDSSEVVELDAPHRLELEVRVGPMTGVVELVVRPSGDGAEVEMRERPTGPAAVLTPFLRPLLVARNGRSLDNLADLFGAKDPGLRA